MPLDGEIPGLLESSIQTIAFFAAGLIQGIESTLATDAIRPGTQRPFCDPGCRPQPWPRKHCGYTRGYTSLPQQP